MRKPAKARAGIDHEARPGALCAGVPLTRLARSVRLAVMLGSGTALAGPAHGLCNLSGTSVSGSVSNSAYCINAATLSFRGGELTNEVSGRLANYGFIEGSGDLVNAGSTELFGSTSLAGSGADITNAGLLTLRGSGNEFVADIANTGTVRVSGHGEFALNSSNLVNGELNDGTWEFVRHGQAGLFVQVGAPFPGLRSNAASLTLRGASVHLDHSLNRNAGDISILDGARLEFTLGLHNTGSLTVGPASELLVVGEMTNDGIIRNDGLVRVVDPFVNTKAAGRFDNKGHLWITGGKLDIHDSGNLEGGHTELVGGSWEIEARNGSGSLSIGSSITATNRAAIILRGDGARFANLDGLSRNAGSLTVTEGATLQLDKNLVNDGTLVIGPASVVTLTNGLANKGSVLNTGTLRVANGINGGNAFDNRGTVELVSGITRIDSSPNLDEGTLSGGRWIVGDGGSAGSWANTKTGTVTELRIGTGDIHTNDAEIELWGAGATFAQIDALSVNRGALTLANGRTFANKARLDNSGILRVIDSNVVVSNTANITDGVLGGGRWEVRAKSGPALLDIGGGKFTTNAADIVVAGAKAGFTGLVSLVRNDGTISIEDGFHYTTPAKSAFLNTGALTVVDASAQVTTSGNLVGSVLSGGTWRVTSEAAPSSLVIGSGDISANGATIELAGAGASFAQLGHLRSNNGTLTIRDGHQFLSDKLHNIGSLNVARDGRFVSKASLVNSGLTEVSGGLASGSGFDNTGTLKVIGSELFAVSGGGTAPFTSGESNGAVLLNGAMNLNNGVLTGGTWELDGRNGLAVLEFGGAAFTTNDATLHLRGQTYIGSSLASEDPFSLRTNHGTLSFDDGASNVRIANFTNTGTMTIGVAGGFDARDFDNSGKLFNAGAFTVVAGKYSGKGYFENTGTVALVEGGSARIDNSGNVGANSLGAVLTGGAWFVTGSQLTSTLSVGVDRIRTNAADVFLSGSTARFSSIDNLLRNEGSLLIAESAALAIDKGFVNTGNLGVANLGKLTTTADLTNTGEFSITGAEVSSNQFSNSGTLLVTSGFRQDAKANFLASGNVSNNVLAGGRWEVVALADETVFGGGHGDRPATASLVLGSSPIRVNQADVLLAGPTSEFAQLTDFLTENRGSLTVALGRRLALNAKLTNHGYLEAAFGGEIVVNNGSSWTNSGEMHAQIGGRFTTAGLVVNKGQITSAGGFSGPGEINNHGLVAVEDSGYIAIRARNVTGSAGARRLEGGTWRITDAGNGARLDLVSDAIDVNAAAVYLAGAGAEFVQFNALGQNLGTLEVAGGATLALGKKFSNGGTLTAGDGGTLRSDGLLSNSAMVEVIGTIAGPGQFAQNAGVTRVNGVLQQAVVDIAGGSLFGGGLVDASLILRGGELNPGNSPGTLFVDGDFSMSDGRFVVEILGTAAGLHDLLEVSGAASFSGGTLAFEFLAGGPPLPTEATFRFLDAASVVGLGTVDVEISGLAAGFSYVLSSDGEISFQNLRLATPASVPLPAGVWLLGLALAGFGLFSVNGRGRVRAY